MDTEREHNGRWTTQLSSTSCDYFSVLQALWGSFGHHSWAGGGLDTTGEQDRCVDRTTEKGRRLTAQRRTPLLAVGGGTERGPGPQETLRA